MKDWMAHDPIVVTPDTTPFEAHLLMAEHKICCLPVADNGKLVGIVTRGDLREAYPSDATSLSTFELNYLLSKFPVKKSMTPNPVTVTPSTTFERAVQIMLEKKICCLPVVERGKPVGIITESDIAHVLVRGTAA